MPDDPAVPQPDAQANPPEPPAPSPDPDREKEIGDFIARHVLEKDTVFFEG